MEIDYWQDLKKTKKFLARVEAELEIHSPEDWYRISHEQFSQLGGETILRKNGGLFPVSVIFRFFSHVH